MAQYTHDPYGSARFATFEEVRAAGLLEPRGPEFGLIHGRPLHHFNRGGVKITGGSGSGKTSQIAIPMIFGGRYTIVVFDFKQGEISRVIEPYCALHGIPFYTVDPYGVTDYPNLRVAPLAHLKASSSTLVPDSQRFWKAIRPDTTSGENGSFFDEAARRYGDIFTRLDVHVRGGTSFQSLYSLFLMVRSNFEAWLDWAETTRDLVPPDIHVGLAVMAGEYATSPKMFDGIMAGISNAFSFMADPAMQETLVDEELADFSLSVIADPAVGPVIVSFIIPDELLEELAAVVRSVISSLRTAKKARPDAPPVHLLIDEAARLGRFGELSQLFSIGRSAGTVPWVFYQDDSQISRNLGATGRGTLETNAALMLDLGGGIRDYETALNRSKSLGYTTVSVDDPLVQTRAESAARELKRQVMFGDADPYEAAVRLRQLDYEASHRTKLRKALAEPEQFLNMSADKMLVQARSYHLWPFIADKSPYYVQRRFAGYYLPNPNEEQDLENVRVRTRWGMRSRKVITEAVPQFLKHLPQYVDGARPLRYVEGFRPQSPNF